MDLKTFSKTTRPAHVSKAEEMAPHLAALLKLRGDGYSLRQLQAYLAANKVTVSVPTIHSYLKDHAK